MTTTDELQSAQTDKHNVKRKSPSRQVQQSNQGYHSCTAVQQWYEQVIK